MTKWQAILGGVLLSSSGWLYAACDFTLEVDDNMRYKVDKLEADASCPEIKVTIKHVGTLGKDLMGHNWVLVSTPDMQSVATDGMTAGGPETNYLKPDDERVIAHTKIVGSGESDTVAFSPSELTAGGDYTFFCSFPGHWQMMHAPFILK